METSAENSSGNWTADWLDSVADGSNTMRQRKPSSVEMKGAGWKLLLP